MAAMRFVGLLVLALSLNGCGPKALPLAGGKPVSHWIAALRDADPVLRRKAVRKLGNVGPTDGNVFPALLGALQDTDVQVRAEAVGSLLKFGRQAREAVPLLRPMRRHDPSARVRCLAGKVLQRILREGEDT
jgi:hypothetical protein